MQNEKHEEKRINAIANTGEQKGPENHSGRVHVLTTEQRAEYGSLQPPNRVQWLAAHPILAQAILSPEVHSVCNLVTEMIVCCVRRTEC